MPSKASQVRVWKLKIGGRVERETIEAALSDACKKAVQKRDPEGSYGVIERVDIREKETVVFISEKPRAAKIFSGILGARVRRKKVTLSGVSRAEVAKFA